MTWLRILSIACPVVIVAWTTAGIFLSFRPGIEPSLTIFHELRPFYLPAVVVSYICDSIHADGPVGWWRIAGLACQVGSWWLYKNSGGDDDRWKRRGRKIAERVTQSGGRLVVVAVDSR